MREGRRGGKESKGRKDRRNGSGRKKRREKSIAAGKDER